MANEAVVDFELELTNRVRVLLLLLLQVGLGTCSTEVLLPALDPRLSWMTPHRMQVLEVAGRVMTDLKYTDLVMLQFERQDILVVGYPISDLAKVPACLRLSLFEACSALFQLPLLVLEHSLTGSSIKLDHAVSLVLSSSLAHSFDETPWLKVVGHCEIDR